MALALKEELHRLVDEIPDTRPDVAQAIFELFRLIIAVPPNDDLLIRRFLHEVAETQTNPSDTDALLARLKASGRVGEQGADDDVDALLRVLDSAPDDDEPLTPEEIEMLDARLLEAKITPTIPHDEVLRRLRA